MGLRIDLGVFYLMRIVGGKEIELIICKLTGRMHCYDFVYKKIVFND